MRRFRSARAAGGDYLATQLLALLVTGGLDELEQRRVEALRLLDHRQVARRGGRDHACARYAPSEFPRVTHRYQRVALAPRDERRAADLAQAIAPLVTQIGQAGHNRA